MLPSQRALLAALAEPKLLARLLLSVDSRLRQGAAAARGLLAPLPRPAPSWAVFSAKFYNKACAQILIRDLLRLPLDVFNPRKWDEHAQLYQALVNLALRD